MVHCRRPAIPFSQARRLEPAVDAEYQPLATLLQQASVVVGSRNGCGMFPSFAFGATSSPRIIESQSRFDEPERAIRPSGPLARTILTEMKQSQQGLISYHFGELGEDCGIDGWSLGIESACLSY